MMSEKVNVKKTRLHLATYSILLYIPCYLIGIYNDKVREVTFTVYSVLMLYYQNYY